MKLTVDFLTVHFGHNGWTKFLVDSLLNCAGDEQIEVGFIHIVDNSRDGWICGQLAKDNRIVFHTFPEDLEQINHYKHDHAASLERAIQLSHADVLVILDCDAHLMRRDFLQYIKEKFVDEGCSAISAPDARYPEAEMTHPCFLALHKAARESGLPFDSRSASREYFDVGRLIGRTLKERGLKVHMAERVRAFDGCWGEIFDSHVYHHGSGTFSQSKASEILKQVDKCAWMFERAVLQKKRLHLTPLEKWHLRFQTRLPWLFQLHLSFRFVFV